MTSPLPLPDWVPWWVHLTILIALSLFCLMFLLMPFAVFGVKGRLELLEARLDEIQGEIRSLSLRLPEPDRGVDSAFPASQRRSDTDETDRFADFDRYAGQRPPIPPAPRDRGRPNDASRTEPRLY